MWPRLLLVCAITTFFVTMTTLLCLREFGGGAEMGQVPIETVWHRVLIAPDASRLEIRHHGKRIGAGTWTANVGEELGGKRMLDETEPEGMIPDPSGYSVEFHGSFSLDATTRIRFDFNLRFSTNEQWQEFGLDLRVRPSVWSVHAAAAEGTVKYTSSDETGHSEQVFKIADLEKPDKLFQQAGWPISPALVAALGLPKNPARAGFGNLGLKWEARNDVLPMAGARVRVYRLQARILDRFQISIFTSLEGQILRVELPDEIVLANDQLNTL